MFAAPQQLRGHGLFDTQLAIGAGFGAENQPDSKLAIDPVEEPLVDGQGID
jgi:hypothetical protein